MDSSPSKMLQPSLVESTESQPEQVRKPTLLPAFDDAAFSSSPFPRPRSSKRKFEDSPTFPKQELKYYYPTPVPTSSTGILPSSSPRHTRPGLDRTVSALSERTPLGAVPTVDLPADGTICRMGRSSNSADYQLSTNRLISRVHVQAAYHAPSASYPQGYIEVECLGWNGAKIHCRGRIFELSKGDTYMSENPETEIMLDVQDTRVMIAWPAISARKLSWDSEEEGMPTPTRRRHHDNFDSSPPIVPRSPVSQSPIRAPVFSGLAPIAQPGPVQVFEDADASRESPSVHSPDPADKTFIRPSIPSSRSSQEVHTLDSKASLLSSFAADDFSDNDEENDPIVHSFGPFGQNLLSGLASFNTTTPTQSNTPRLRAPLLSPSPKRTSTESVRFKESPIKNHVINQLAFSRIHSQPLSVIHSNLPAELKGCVTKSNEGKTSDDSDSTPIPQLSRADLKKILDETPCVGEIPRAGKDAAGQPLENEFYYVPEMDSNQMRRETITAGTRSTGLRSVRKTHKQYYWKKPRV
ncbi:Nn.00g031480.m01.CDS01 [Neocucurbitaria sp. VM-36]